MITVDEKTFSVLFTALISSDCREAQRCRDHLGLVLCLCSCILPGELLLLRQSESNSKPADSGKQFVNIYYFTIHEFVCLSRMSFLLSFMFSAYFIIFLAFPVLASQWYLNLTMHYTINLLFWDFVFLFLVLLTLLSFQVLSCQRSSVFQPSCTLTHLFPIPPAAPKYLLWLHSILSLAVSLLLSTLEISSFSCLFCSFPPLPAHFCLVHLPVTNLYPHPDHTCCLLWPASACFELNPASLNHGFIPKPELVHISVNLILNPCHLALCGRMTHCMCVCVCAHAPACAGTFNY